MWTKPPRRRPGDPDPFDYSRLYGNEKYSLNNMLMNSVNATNTATLKPPKRAIDFWSDRSHSEWRAASEGIISQESGDALVGWRFR